MTLKSFKEITEEKLERGSRIERKENPRHTGTIYQINHRADGSTAHVQWDNGWKEHHVKLDSLKKNNDDKSSEDVNQQLRKSLRSK